MKKISVLLDARMVSSQTHGIGRYTYQLIESLSQFDSYQISIIYHQQTTLELLKPLGIHQAIRTLLSFAHPMAFLELQARSLQFRPFDVVHWTSFEAPAWTPSPSIITLHDLIHLRNPSILHMSYFFGPLKQALKNARSVLTVSEHSKSEILRHYPFLNKKIFVIRNGLEAHWFKPNSIESPPNEKTVLALGNDKPHKNLNTLIRACLKLWEEKLDFKLALSLGGQDIPRSWSAMSPLVTKNTILLRNASEAALKSLYAEAYCLVSPSLEEGFNYPIAEALSQGCKVICSDIPAHREFQAPHIQFYGPPQDLASLKARLKETLTAPRQTFRPYFEQTSDSFAQQVAKFYTV
ncbi:MAG: glycosyltransferase family 4 protein [Oligoflexia bacterium]|nr:glycosyltransferase family 4 protein [Oligoflexia bacterium]